jgi:KDO2-lipid IV(A) lauroyltransferase
MAKDNNRYTLTRGEKFLSNLLFALCRFVAILPRWVRYYVIEDLIYFILRFVLHYRRDVIMTNLRNAFPERDEEELRSIMHKCYRNLAEQMINTISLAGITPEQLKQRATFPDAKKYIDGCKGDDTILMAGHIGCWEYFMAAGIYNPTHKLVSVFHPLNNNALDDLFRRLRKIPNTEAIPRDESLRYFLKNRGGKGAERFLTMGLIADQNPYRHKDSHWFRFLNQDTIFAEGGEQLALKLHLPVWYIGLKYRRRGEYDIFVELLYDGKEEVAEFEITERYIRVLEREICAAPHLWLWSHRRWKHKKEE